MKHHILLCFLVLVVAYASCSIFSSRASMEVAKKRQISDIKPEHVHQLKARHHKRHAMQAPPVNPSITPRRWIDPLPIPGVHTPKSTLTDGTPYYEVAITEIQHKFHTDLPATRLFAYGGAYPGPSFVVKQGKPIQAKFLNQLTGTDHVLPIDKTVMGAESNTDVLRVVTHLHGGFVDVEDDGHPMAWFTKDFAAKGHHWSKQTYTYPNKQDPATIIYHDHAIGITRLNVLAGLIGLYIITPPDHTGFSPYDIPLLVQDKAFTADGKLWYPTVSPDNATLTPSIVDNFFGNAMMVNGKIWPYLNVEPRKYRFRIVNGCNTRTLNMTIVDDATGAVLPMNIVGADQGYFDKVVTVNKIVQTSAERHEVFVDFTGMTGKSFTLRNVDVDFFKPVGNFTTVVMKINVNVALNTANPAITESQVLIKTPLEHPTPTVNRVVTTDAKIDNFNRLFHVIDGKTFHDPPTETPYAGATEVWTVINASPDFDHPIHIHESKMKVLNRTFFDTAFFDESKKLRFTSPTFQPEAYEYGWKDVIRTSPGTVTNILVQFGNGTGEYVWHCHILEHEDFDMMRPLLIRPLPPTPPKGNNSSTIGYTVVNVCILLISMLAAALF